MPAYAYVSAQCISSCEVLGNARRRPRQRTAAQVRKSHDSTSRWRAWARDALAAVKAQNAATTLFNAHSSSLSAALAPGALPHPCAGARPSLLGTLWIQHRKDSTYVIIV